MTLESLDICKKALAQEDRSDIIKFLIRSYSQESFDNSADIADYCATAVKSIMKKHIEKVRDMRMALEQSVNQYVLQKDDASLLDGTYLLSSMIPVCMQMFPEGHCRGDYSVNQKKYFADFISLLTDSKYFDYQRDHGWANSFGYLKYIQTVLKEIRDNAEDED